jgi:hypothetical protein
LSRDLEAEPLNRERLEAGFNWLLEDGCERDMEFAFLLTAVAEYTKSHDAPELVEALRVISPRHAGVAHPDYKPPPRRKIVYAPTFVEGYADLTGQSVKEARAALRQGEGSFHLEAVSDERP